MANPSTYLPHLQLWHALLDNAIASVALSDQDRILACGSANDVRNLLVAVEMSKKWSSLTMSGQVVTGEVAKVLERSALFWDVAKHFKDAKRTRRAHLNINIYSGPFDITNSILNQDTEFRNASLNETNFKFLTLQNIQRVVLIIRDEEKRRPPPIELGDITGLQKVLVTADGMTHAYEDVCSRGKVTPLCLDRLFWNSCVARGLAMQLRWDFGITNSIDEIETTVAKDMMDQVAVTNRYNPRTDVKNKYKAVILDDVTVERFGDGIQNVTNDQAEVILRILHDTGEVDMGIPGLSTKCAMIRRRAQNEHTIPEIMKAANVLKTIEQHQEGGQVPRRRLQQVLAIGYVILASAFSVLVGVINFGNRDNRFERISDSISTATLLLVSVFGLLKLTSEDDNAIRNTLLGYKVLRKFDDVEKYYRRNRGCPVSIQTALAAVDAPLHWLADSNTCYLRQKPVGTIAYTGGIRAGDVRQLGMLFGSKLMLDYRLSRSTWNTGDERVGVHMERKLVATDIGCRMEVGREDCVVA